MEKMRGLSTWIIAVGFISLTVILAACSGLVPGGEAEINSFQECVDAGQPVMESYPRQCRNPEGTLFVEDIGNEAEKADLIRLNAPRPNQSVTSPLVVEGEARGTWFFEADFPVRLLDAGGNELAGGAAQAQGEWMTEDFVPFRATLEFDVQEAMQGTLRLEKANPSGLPENDDALIVPVEILPQ